MSSVLSRTSACSYHGLNSSWHGFHQPLAVGRCNGAPSLLHGYLCLLQSGRPTSSHSLLRDSPNIFDGIKIQRVCHPRQDLYSIRDKPLIVLVLVDLALWAGAKSCLNVNSSPPNSCSAVGSRKCFKTS